MGHLVGVVHMNTWFSAAFFNLATVSDLDIGRPGLGSGYSLPVR